VPAIVKAGVPVAVCVVALPFNISPTWFAFGSPPVFRNVSNSTMALGVIVP
jgi:hypothetical protein